MRTDSFFTAALVCCVWLMCNNAHGDTQPTLVLSGALGGGFELNASSGAVPADALDNDWQGRVRDADVLWGDQRLSADISIHFRFNQWQYLTRIGGISRKYVYADFNAPTGRFVHALNQNSSSFSAQTDLNLSLTYLKLQGLYWAQSVRFGAHEVGITASSYQLLEYQHGTIKGVSQRNADGELGASAVVDYWFDRDRLLDFKPYDPTGGGYSFDVAYAFHGHNWRWGVQARDAINQFSLLGAGHTQACIGIGEVRNPTCANDGAGQGLSDDDDQVISITAQHTLWFGYAPWRSLIDLVQVGRYWRVGGHYRVWSDGDAVPQSLIQAQGRSSGVYASVFAVRSHQDTLTPAWGVTFQKNIGAWRTEAALMGDHINPYQFYELSVQLRIQRSW